MELKISEQARLLVLAHAGGWLMGLIYDLLRPPRRRLTKTWASMLDVIFCIVAGAGTFIFAMGAGSGRLGVWELAAALMGFLLYLYTLSRFLEPLLDKICGGAWKIAAGLKKLTKKIKILKKDTSKNEKNVLL